MIYLVWKDLLLQKRMLPIMFLYIVFFSFSFQGMPDGQFIAILVAVGYLFVMMGCAWEDKNNSDVLWNSLPVARWRIVGAKYLSIEVYVLMVVPAYWLVRTVFTLLEIPVSIAPISGWGMGIGIGIVFLIASLYLPIFFALGYTKSRYWNFLLFAAFFTFGSLVPKVFPEPPAWLQNLQDAPLEMFWAGFGGVVVLIVAISFFVSLLMYARREF